ncbi:folate family ECF transporter S component [Caldicoprobacter faecalis]|uniref:ECF transporter S component, folate family n=1 Tax=Caldicoprobacter faecalis TaxID=937334 RepID=A0A1I5WNC8_9FIRM|nr:folate family ECF transporter S component [Caldicoprobacter faecalis]PZN10446.1 MAG: folate family ECF transporter S component [Caldicoprobacter oshimai]SFQ21071.1 ECF transporter S component, folate family [Caldicoprobacter faecalis]
MSRLSDFSIRTITISGLLIALNVVLSSVLTIPGVISFGGFPIIFGGIVLGPVAGGVIGAIGDVLSFIARPSSSGPFMPHFTLTSALTGVIPGIMVRLLKVDFERPSFWKILVSIFLGQTITSVIMVPYFRNILFGHPLWLTMTKAASRQMLNIPLYSVVITILLRVLYRAGVIELVRQANK